MEQQLGLLDRLAAAVQRPSANGWSNIYEYLFREQAYRQEQ